MSRFTDKFTDYLYIAFCIHWKYWLIIACLGIWAIKCAFVEPEPHPMDRGEKAICKITTVDVVDSTYNGFKIRYYSTEPITEARAEQISKSDDFRNGYRKLRDEANSGKLGDMMAMDIYDFAAIAFRYSVGRQAQIDTIMVTGSDKCALYIGPNPAIPDSGEKFDNYTEQGAQFITREDFLHNTAGGQRIYRYLECDPPFSTSTTDERYSHFSERAAKRFPY